jgi:hypothetical protein
MPINKDVISKEMFLKAVQCKSADELIALAKTDGIELTKEEAEAYMGELPEGRRLRASCLRYGRLGKL